VLAWKNWTGCGTDLRLMPNIAAFYSMLLQLQKLGISYVSTQKNWKKLYDAEIKEDARPLIILRNFDGVESKSKTYLANFVKDNQTINSLDIYQFMRVVDQIESIIDLNPQAQFAASHW
jgi:hypothetical protein